MLPTIPAELTKRERLKPLSGGQAGAKVSIDRGELAELYTRLAEAVGAVERGNARAASVERWWRCVNAIWRTGRAETNCSPLP